MAFHRTAFAPPRQKDRVPLRVFMPLALPVVVLLGVLAFAALTPYSHTTGPPPGAPGALVWGNGIFANTFELKAWLNQHGASYRSWAKQHPAAIRLVKAKPAKAHPAAAAKTKPAPAVAARASVGETTVSKTDLSTKNRYLLVALGLLVLGVGLLPRRALARVGMSERASAVRTSIAGAGLAILVGVAVAALLG
jgi:hypothetical protein